MDNEKLLAQGECPRPSCIEAAGHTGPCSGDLVRAPLHVFAYADLQTQLQAAREENKEWQRIYLLHLGQALHREKHTQAELMAAERDAKAKGLRVAERRDQYDAQMMAVESCVLGWVLTEMDAEEEAPGAR